jgi:hypothetical protein
VSVEKYGRPAPAPKITTRPLLEEVLQREGVHDGAEHAHVVRASTVHAALAELSSAEEVASADDDRDLDILRGQGDLFGESADDVWIDAERASPEGFTGKLEQNPSLARVRHALSFGCGSL